MQQCLHAPGRSVGRREKQTNNAHTHTALHIRQTITQRSCVVEVLTIVWSLCAPQWSGRSFAVLRRHGTSPTPRPNDALPGLGLELF